MGLGIFYFPQVIFYLSDMVVIYVIFNGVISVFFVGFTILIPVKTIKKAVRFRKIV